MSAPLVVITDSDEFSQGVEERILADAGLRVRRAQCRSAREVIAAAKGAVALIVQSAPVSSEVLERLESVRLVSRLGVGADRIDVRAATERGVAVVNTPPCCAEEVVLHTVGLVLNGIRGVKQLDHGVRDGRWGVVSIAPALRRPSATTLVVIGFGRIGSRVAQACSAIGFRVLVYDPLVAADTIRAAGYERVGRLDALRRADVLTLHAPLTAVTHHWLDAAAFAELKPGSFVVNTSPGGLIDEAALADALRAGRIAGAALDTFETEPLPADSELLNVPNLHVTPRAAWYSTVALRDLQEQAARHVVDFLAGRKLEEIVNPEYLEAMPDAVPALR
jgi:D-3-phosphoglycerate dehydrogenase